jgi:apolipoprotein N-acyltransferase
MTALSQRIGPRLHKAGGQVLCGVVSIACMSAGFAPFNLFWLVWVGVALWIWRVTLMQSTFRAAVFGYATGLIYFLVNFSWLWSATRSGHVVVALILSTYFALLAAIVFRARKLPSWKFAMVVAAAWVACDYLRGIVFGGFPWLFLGHTQSSLLALCQVADVTGAMGVTFWAALISVTLLCAARRRREAILLFILTPTITLVMFIYGIVRMTYATTPSDLRIALVQPNHIHLAGGAKPLTQPELVDYHLKRSEGIDADLIVWSETTMPALNVEARTEPGLGAAPFLNRAFQQLGDFAGAHNANLVAGGYYVGGWQGTLGKRRATDIRNSVYLFTPDGRQTRYDKVNLVPFAEYVTFHDSWPWMHGQLQRFATAAYATGYRLTAGDDAKALEVSSRGRSFRFATPICFEDTVGSFVARFFAPDANGRKGADAILNISNDGWFNASEKHQHFQIAIFRSIENRVPTARVSNTGISAFCDSSGRVVSSAGVFRDEILNGTISLDDRITLYTRFGDWFSWACVIATASFLATTFRRRRDPRDGSTHFGATADAST